MRLRCIGMILVAGVLAGCATVDVTKTAKGFYDPTNPNDVEIRKTMPERPFDELGTVTAVNFPPAETAKMHNALRSKSAALGADAVILTEEGVTGGGYKWATGVAVRYKPSGKED